MTPREAYALADRAYRYVCPQFLEYDDGIRKPYPELARLMREQSPITDTQSAYAALRVLAKEIAVQLYDVRDGQLTVPTRQAHWLIQAAIEMEAGRAVPADYGYRVYPDLSDAMGIPIHV